MEAKDTGFSFDLHVSQSAKKLFLFYSKGVRVLQSGEGSVKSICFDPKGELLASATCDGILHIWNVEDRSVVSTQSVFPKTVIDGTGQLLRMDWSPDGDLLALPGKPEVKIIDRNRWKTKVRYFFFF